MPDARVRTTKLDELWFHTGTACNLECPFCFEGSRPGDARLERVTLADLRPYIEEARALGVRRLVFTGGEPLIVKDIVRILGCALGVAPCLVLTNGTAPLLRRVQQLDLLKSQPCAPAFRVSIDYPDAERHDAGRGWGNLRRSLEGLALLHQRGFEVSVTRQRTVGEDHAAVDAAYRELFARNGLPRDLAVNAVPDYGVPGGGRVEPGITREELERFRQHGPGNDLMCSSSKMVVKRAGRMRIYACPLVDDDEYFDQGASIAEALRRDVRLCHRRCRGCLDTGANLGGRR
jgi:MoaA/NifB/PqqE/SkfB family radical SAM enzyme